MFFLLHEESLKVTYRYISRWLLDYVRPPAEEFITPNIFVSTGLRRERPHWKREGHTETRHTITWASITLILTGGGCARVAKRMSRSRRLGFTIYLTPLYLAWRFIRFNNFHICLLRCIEVFEYSVFKFRLKYACTTCRLLGLCALYPVNMVQHKSGTLHFRSTCRKWRKSIAVVVIPVVCEFSM